MKKIFVLGLLIVSVLGCTKQEQENNEDKIKSAFHEYVKNNFDDPNSFVEFVEIQACDTFSTKTIKGNLKKVS